MINIDLHPKQEEVFYDDARFKVVAAGRRFGKTFLAVVMLLYHGMMTKKTRSDGAEIDLSLEEIFYIHPTFDQGKKIVWPLLIKLGGDAIKHKHEQTGTVTLTNGRKISIKGADRPDNLRGTGLSFVVLDEYAFMKGSVWDFVIEPQLLNAEGGALFIGTPDGKNHFFDLWNDATTGKAGDDWKAWHFVSLDNPFLPRDAIEKQRKKAQHSEKQREKFKQELEASFEAAGGRFLVPGNFEVISPQQMVDLRLYGDRHIAIDLAGFSSAHGAGGRTLERRDSHAIACVLAHEKGWLVEEIIHGQWDTRETALRIVKAFRDHKPASLGIEKGMAQKAVLPYLSDQQARLGIHFDPVPLTHGNKNKADRICWALQGRSEKGRIQLLDDAHLPPERRWINTFFQQCLDFPNQLAHDDLIDALSYIDQLAMPWNPRLDNVIDYWDCLDDTAGY